MAKYKLPLHSEMERIEQSVISERLDEIFERIDKEGIGFVITEGSNDKYVLCPYWWYEDNPPDEIDCIANSAIRQELTTESDRRETFGKSPVIKEDNLVTVEVNVDADLLRQVKELIEPMGITVEQLFQRFLEWLVHPDTTEEATALLLKWKEDVS